MESSKQLTGFVLCSATPPSTSDPLLLPEASNLLPESIDLIFEV